MGSAVAQWCEYLAGTRWANQSIMVGLRSIPVTEPQGFFLIKNIDLCNDALNIVINGHSGIVNK